MVMMLKTSGFISVKLLLIIIGDLAKQYIAKYVYFYAGERPMLFTICMVPRSDQAPTPDYGEALLSEK